MIRSTTTGDHRIFPLMPLSPLAPDFSLTTNCHPILLSRCGTLPQGTFLLPKFFLECRLFYLLLFTSLNPSMTAPTSLSSCRGTHPNRIPNPFSFFLDLTLSFPYPSTFKHSFYTRSKRQSNSFSSI